MVGLKRGTVRLVPYDFHWKKEFKEERKILKKVLGDKAVDIQHVGSTSIPGMRAKPIIDISVGVKSMRGSENLIPLFEAVGYEYRPNFGGADIQLLFVRGEEKNRTHYIHVMKYKGSIWNNDLLFRDFLKTHKDWAEKYSLLKENLANKFANDRGKYTASKAEFIHKIIELAKTQ